MNIYCKVVIGATVVIVLAADITVAVLLPRPSPTENLTDYCTLTGNSLDLFDEIKAYCADIIVEDFTVPAGKSLNFTGVQDGTTITFRGTITFEYEEWDGHFIVLQGSNIRVIGENGNLLDGRGALWWDGLGGNGGKLKPKFLRTYYLYNSIIEGLNIRNTPRHCFSINFSENVTLSNISLDNKDGDYNGGHNTDAFDVSNSNYIYIKDSHVVNQDDCLAVNSGSNYFFYNNYCSGGHGISIGSVGNRTENLVENVHVKNCTIVNSENGIRIKTVYLATGLVTNVTYEDITIKNNTDYGIVIRGDYLNTGPTGTPTDGIPITNLTIRNVQGWVQSTATNVFVLLADGMASNWYWENVSITGGTVYQTCSGIPEELENVCS